MDYNGIEQRGADVRVLGVRHFTLEEILDCGQCFRWEKTGDGRFGGVAFGRYREIAQEGDTLTVSGCTPEEWREVWHPYFDLDRDYGQVKALLCGDEAMRRAVAFCPGMRVLRQEPWEALCSFIISANNNIPRIKGIVGRLCEQFGEQLPGGHYAFPTPQVLAALELEALAGIRAGFRAKYILDAAQLVSGGQLDLQALYTMELDEARRQLQRIKGVGPKVAECALLYGLGRAECLPVDVWIKRALEQLYPDGYPEAFAGWAGLGQQYLFHYMRKCPQAATV